MADPNSRRPQDIIDAAANSSRQPSEQSNVTASSSETPNPGYSPPIIEDDDDNKDENTEMAEAYIERLLAEDSDDEEDEMEGKCFRQLLHLRLFS